MSDLIKEFEGYINTIYLCPADVVTFGYGHKVLKGDVICGISGAEILKFAGGLVGSRKDKNKYLRQKYNFGASESLAAAETLHNKDILKAKKAIKETIKVPLNKNQLEALVSFVFNIGIGAFSASTLLKKLRNSDYEGASKEFLRWNKITVGGELVVSHGLTSRRKKEAELFNKAV